MEKKDFRQDLKIKDYWLRNESSYLKPISTANS